MVELFIGANIISHDTSIFIVDSQNKQLYGMSSERMTRYKHDNIMPINALQRLIDYTGIKREEVERVFIGGSFTSAASYFGNFHVINTQIKMRDFLGALYAADFNRLYKEFSMLESSEKIAKLQENAVGQEILRSTTDFSDKNTSFTEYFHNAVCGIFPNAEVKSNHFDHEMCHAISSYFSSPFDRGLLITMDGSGDNTFSHAYVANAETIRNVATSPGKPIPEEIDYVLKLANSSFWSIGAIYSWFTKCLGYNFGDEGKIEALAAFGKPIPDLLSTIVDHTHFDDEKHAIDIDYDDLASCLNEERMKLLTNEHGAENMAATVQKYLEDTVYRYVSHLMEYTGEKQLMLSGGVFANVILNLKIFEGLTKSIFVVPAMADDGAAQGAAVLAMISNGHRIPALGWLRKKHMPYFGTSYSRQEVKEALFTLRDQIDIEDLGNDWPERIAELVLRERVGGIFHGRMEWGPRALGNRSIIADPRDPGIRDFLNISIKKRTHFQPFCPSILLEEKDRLFHDAYDNRHMTCAFRMKEEFWSALPGAIHVDGTARVQFVSEEDNQNYYRLLSAVKKLTGYGVLINTSFNKHGRTIVESPVNAVTDFLDTNMPFVCIEGYLVTRKAAH